MMTRWTVAAAVLMCAVAMAGGDKAASQPSGGLVDFRKLKELLPAELGGITRTETGGESLVTAQLSMSTANASYVKDADKDDAPRISVTFVDYGPDSKMLAAQTAWTSMSFDRDSDDEQSRTCKVAGFAAVETFQKKDKSLNLLILVGGRFLVTLEVEKLSLDDGRRIGESLPLAKLAELK
jgi:hypothetical protein